MPAMGRVLVIAYYFPPLGLSGVQRTLKFVKYLPDFGWEPTVLTVEDRGYFAKDAGLLDELDGRPVSVVRTRSIDPLHFFRGKGVVKMPSAFAQGAFGKLSQTFLIPDNKIGWKKRALAAARDLHRAAPFDAIYATAPPYTDLLIGARLRADLGVPLVFDYRDAWLENPLHFYPTPLHRALHHRLETRALRHADHVVTINRRIKELLVRGNPFLAYQDVTVIPQGFDAEDFPDDAPVERSARFRIAHAGTFYWNRTPRHFLHGLHSFLALHPEARPRVEAVFVGNFREEDRRQVAALGLDDVVRAPGYLPHRECIAALREATVLWMMIGRGAGDDMMSTGKLYEYLGARKPILACVPEGVARQTLERSGCAFLTGPDDVEAIAARLEELYGLYERGKLPAPAPGFAAQFERRGLTAELARIFVAVQGLGPLEARVSTVRNDGEASAPALAPDATEREEHPS